MKNLTNTQAEQLGTQIIAILDLKVKPNGRVDTLWGDKTVIGLGRTIARLTENAVNETFNELLS